MVRGVEFGLGLNVCYGAIRFLAVATTLFPNRVME